MIPTLDRTYRSCLGIDEGGTDDEVKAFCGRRCCGIKLAVSISGGAWASGAVEQAVDSFLQNPNESLRRDLLTALEELDDQLAQGDAYHARLRMFTGQSTIVGATSATSVGQELPATEFQAQVAPVKAAKNAVVRLTPDTLADVRAASDAVAESRTGDQ